MRSKSGSALALVLAWGILVLCICMFALAYVRQLASSPEQNTAIEAAALAAAKDISRIVINDPVFGYVGLVDSAPQGAGVAAKDGYGLPVRSINTVLGTIRLNMLIADRLQNDAMRRFAQADYANAQLTIASLTAALKDSLLSTPSGHYTDTFGQPVTPYADALSAYQSNIVRMQGASSLAAGSLELTLGTSSSAGTMTQIPNSPGTGLDVPTSLQNQGCYVANKDVPYSNKSFWFAALSDRVVLIKGSDFIAQSNSGSNSVPSAVQAIANHQFKQADGKTYLVRASASAQAGGPQNNLPAPGALVLTMPDGCPEEFPTIQSMLSDPGITAATVTYYKPTGDYPVTTGSTLAPVAAATYPCGAAYATNVAATWSDAISLAIYLWVRKVGPTINAQAVVNMMNSKFWPATAQENSGLMIVFTANTTTGQINRTVLASQQIYASDSDQQLVAVSSKEIAVSSIAQAFDLVVNYNVFHPGIAAGAHGGEPLQDSRLTQNPLFTASYTPPAPPPIWTWCTANVGWDSLWGGWAYDKWASYGGTWAGGDETPAPIPAQPQATQPGQIRATYLKNGVAIELALHRAVYKPLMWDH